MPNALPLQALWDTWIGVTSFHYDNDDDGDDDDDDDDDGDDDDDTRTLSPDAHFFISTRRQNRVHSDSLAFKFTHHPCSLSKDLIYKRSLVYHHRHHYLLKKKKKKALLFTLIAVFCVTRSVR